jgi:hypothetical protein
VVPGLTIGPDVRGKDRWEPRQRQRDSEQLATGTAGSRPASSAPPVPVPLAVDHIELVPRSELLSAVMRPALEDTALALA